jgi:hypothetical protein
MFLEKPEDIALFNKLMETHTYLEPSFAELALWCYLHDKKKYLSLVEESKKDDERLHLKDVSERLQVSLEPRGSESQECLQEIKNI